MKMKGKLLFAVFPHSSHSKVSLGDSSRRFPQSSQNCKTIGSESDRKKQRDIHTVGLNAFGNKSYKAIKVLKTFSNLMLSKLKALAGLLREQFLPKNRFFKYIYIYSLSWSEAVLLR